MSIRDNQYANWGGNFIQNGHGKQKLSALSTQLNDVPDEEMAVARDRRNRG